MDLLTYKGAKIDYHDPFVNEFGNLRSINLTAQNIQEYDSLVITTDHRKIDNEKI